MPRWPMLKNDDIVEQFKKSLSITVKSIGKNNDLDINFIKENPSIDGNSINLTEPNIENLQKNLTYLRAEADAMALEFRLHSKDIHKNFIASDELSNEIFNAVEQSRIEAQGSKIFKGIKSNIIKKHRYDLKKNNKTNKKINIADAFRYVSYSELLEIDLGENYLTYKKIIQQKLGKKYESFFKKLKNHINDQEKFSLNMKDILVELGLFNLKNNINSSQENSLEDKTNENSNDKNKDDNKTENNTEMEYSSIDM